MPNLKTTERKGGVLCSLCKKRLATTEEWKEHFIMCGMRDLEKKSFECSDCDNAFEKKANLDRHKERCHNKEFQDPTIRKPTKPSCPPASSSLLNRESAAAACRSVKNTVDAETQTKCVKRIKTTTTTKYRVDGKDIEERQEIETYEFIA